MLLKTDQRKLYTMPIKKNKSSIKYGNYIYNELKEKKKIVNIDDNNLPVTGTNFLTTLGTLVNQYRKYFLPVFTLGGYPIDDSAYDRNTSILRKSLKEYFNYSNTTIDYSYYEINDNNLEDYLLLCEAQDSIIEESFKDYEISEEEFIDSICGIKEEVMQQINDFYDSIPNNPYSIT